jgi:ABC-type amino acid transport substrate-binding protein
MDIFTIKLKRLFAFFACVFLVACGKENTNEEDRPLVVMVSPDNPPFEFKDTGSGGKGVLGFDIDLINMVGKQLGREIKIVEVDFSAIIPGIQSKRADMGISGIAATEKRRKSVDFSDPYHSYSFAVVTKQDTVIDNHQDLANKRIGAQLGSTHETKSQELSAILPGVSVFSLNKLPELILEVKKGRAGAVMTEEAVAKRIVASNADLKYKVLDDIEGESYFIVFPKDSPLVSEVNRALEDLKSSGQIDQLITKWIAN